MIVNGGLASASGRDAKNTVDENFMVEIWSELDERYRDVDK